MRGGRRTGAVDRFRLYVAGDSPNSRQAIANFEALRERLLALGSRCELELVDVLEQPGRAVADCVLVTPTLLRLSDPPRRLVGNLSDTAAVQLALVGPPAGPGDLSASELGVSGEQVLDLVRQLAQMESNLEALVADQADAIVHPGAGVPILLSQAQAELQRSEARYRQLAHHDPLTGLPNRLLFASRLEHAIEHARRHQRGIALLYLDVDRFKGINDALGHRVGDAVLKEFGRRLLHCVRSVDTVARIGGDEFAILLEELGGPDDARRLAVKLIRAICRPMAVDGLMIHSSTSIGIALLPQDAEQGEAFLQAADDAMYRAKSRGRGSYEFFNAALNIDFSIVQSLEQELTAALEKGELELHYQPEVELASGRVIAMEALLRWRHPERGLLRPHVFMVAAENTEVMELIGDWVMENACRQADQWRRAGHAVRMNINLSARELTRTDLVERFQTIYAGLGVGPGTLDLEIEIPERLLTAATHNAEVLGALAGLGVHLTVDHYGRDHCPITTLKMLPVVRLKLAGEILDATSGASHGPAIARGLIAMGHALGLAVGLSGVETEAQLGALLPERCDEAQGFLFSRPLTAEAATALLARNEPVLH